MRKVLLAIVFCLGLAVASVTAQVDRCFKNDGLKLQQIASFTLTGNKLEGTFESGGYSQDTSMETFEFTGIKRGNLLTIKFAGRPPYERPPGTRTIVWTLGATTLKVPMFGKNHKTGKFAAYTATFEKCKEI
jgi:hypothetical protein